MNNNKSWSEIWFYNYSLEIVFKNIILLLIITTYNTKISTSIFDRL